MKVKYRYLVGIVMVAPLVLVAWSFFNARDVAIRQFSQYGPLEFDDVEVIFSSYHCGWTFNFEDSFGATYSFDISFLGDYSGSACSVPELDWPPSPDHLSREKYISIAVDHLRRAYPDVGRLERYNVQSPELDYASPNTFPGVWPNFLIVEIEERPEFWDAERYRYYFRITMNKTGTVLRVAHTRGRGDRDSIESPEPDVRQVSPEAAPSALPGEPST